MNSKKGPGSQEIRTGAEREPESSAFARTAGSFYYRHLRKHRTLLILTVIVAGLALIPLYGVLFPLNVDLAMHILISKLLWEKVSGTTQLDIEVSHFLGYRLSAVLLASIIAFCSMSGISLIYVPIMSVFSLISGHALIVVASVKGAITDRTWKGYLLAVCFILPAVVAMYAACWYFGFVSFTVGVTLLVPAVFLTERFLRSGRFLDAFFVFLALFFVYTAHPFAEVFWVFWCCCRALSAILTGTIFVEWKRLILLILIFLPITLYNFWATSGTDLVWQGFPFLSNSPFISPGEWYQHRLAGFYYGALLKADDVTDPRLFALVTVGLVVLSTIIAFRLSRTRAIRNFVLSNAILFFLASWINDKFIPGPWAFWVAWDLRATSTVYVLCLAVAGAALIRASPVVTDKLSYKIAVACIALLAIAASFDQLIEVRKAYARFDPPARQYMARVFDHASPTGIVLPHGRWNPDGSFLGHYICLQQPDCNPDGTPFKSLGGIVWAVKVKGSLATQPPAQKVDTNAPINAFSGGQGNKPGQFSEPRGIASDKLGNFYVADTGNRRVQKFDHDGNFISSVGNKEAGPRDFGPRAVAVDDSGTMYVIDATNSRLMRFAASGTLEKEWNGPEPGFYGPNDISMAPDKNLYIVDEGRNRIVKFDPKSEAFSVILIASPGDTKMPDPIGIAVSTTYIFVTDKANNRVKVFDLAGHVVRQWNVDVWGDYVWHYPDVAVDEQAKRVYVSYGWGNEILAFALNGDRSTGADFMPSGPSALGNPSSLAIQDINGKRRLLVLSSSGCKVTPIELTNETPTPSKR